MADKQLYPLELARQTGLEIAEWFKPACQRIILAGSIRREKPQVGDIEILLIPIIATVDVGELFPQPANLFERALHERLAHGDINLRRKKDGTTSNGPKVKLCRHSTTGIPVDFFLTTAENWISSLVCRTGSKESNEEIAKRAKKLGYQWKMGGAGFIQNQTGQVIPAFSEEDIFSFVGLPCLDPKNR